MLAQVRRPALRGIESYLVRVEVNFGSGPPVLLGGGPGGGGGQGGEGEGVGGPPELGVLHPAREDHRQPGSRRYPKRGERFDLPLALGLLAGAGQIPAEGLDEYGLRGGIGPGRNSAAGSWGSFHGGGCRKGGIGTLVLPWRTRPKEPS